MGDHRAGATARRRSPGQPGDRPAEEGRGPRQDRRQRDRPGPVRPGQPRADGHAGAQRRDRAQGRSARRQAQRGRLGLLCAPAGQQRGLSAQQHADRAVQELADHAAHRAADGHGDPGDDHPGALAADQHRHAQRHGVAAADARYAA